MKVRIALYTLLCCLPLVCLGKVGEALRSPSIVVSDTIKKKPKKSRHQLPDTVSVSYENGKFNGPGNLSGNDLRELARQQRGGFLARWRQRRQLKRGEPDMDAQRQRKVDSALTAAAGASSFTRQLKPRTQFPGAQIHSDKRIKELYDSAGVNGTDTLLALMKLKKPISEDDLMQRINSSVGGHGNSAGDLSKVRLQEEALRELTPLTGRSLKPDFQQAFDSLTGKMILPASLDSMAFPDSVTTLRGAKIIAYKDTRELDSLKEVYGKRDSVVFMSRAKSDSIKISWLHAVQLKQKKLEVAVSTGSDSLRNINHAIHKNALREKVITDKLSELPIPVKSPVFHRFYFEGLVSLNKTALQDEIRLSPGVGFMVTDAFSVGGGLNILISRQQKQLRLLTGYRMFAKYQFLKQKAYLQVEDLVEPARKIGEGNRALSRHSILAGGGYVLAIGSSLGLNGAILYRINNNQYSDGYASPWVFRIGISSIRSKQK